MPARMWRHGIHSFFDLLRHRPHVSVACLCSGRLSVPSESARPIVGRLAGRVRDGGIARAAICPVAWARSGPVPPMSGEILESILSPLI